MPDFYEMLRAVQLRTGMYIVDPTYASVSAFICGMDLGSDNKMLDGIENWVRSEFNVVSPRFFPAYIDDIFEVKSGGRGTEPERIDFLFEVILKFLSEHQTGLTGAPTQ